MVLEDGHALAAEAAEDLRVQKSALDLPNLQVVRLTEFRRTAGEKKLTRADKETICEQAILVVDQFYAHLPFKKARYAFDPVQRLRLLQAQISQTEDDLQFHGALLGIFAEMRDAHTFYGLPAPCRGAVAFLPFFMQSYVEQGERRYVVTNVLAGFAHLCFRPGVEVTGSNGMPVSTAVNRLAEDLPAGNPAAQFLRGLMRITVRPLTCSMPPDEELVFVQYRTADDNQERALALPWHVASGIAGGVFQSRAPGVCDALADQNAAWNILWGQRAWDEQERLQAAEAHAATTALQVRVFPSRATLPPSLKHEDYLFSGSGAKSGLTLV